jgi:hypothetical protein
MMSNLPDFTFPTLSRSDSPPSIPTSSNSTSNQKHAHGPRLAGDIVFAGLCVFVGICIIWQILQYRFEKKMKRRVERHHRARSREADSPQRGVEHLRGGEWEVIDLKDVRPQ